MRIAALISVLCLLLASCETLKGVGRDLENAGDALEDAVDGV